MGVKDPSHSTTQVGHDSVNEVGSCCKGVDGSCDVKVMLDDDDSDDTEDAIIRTNKKHPNNITAVESPLILTTIIQCLCTRPTRPLAREKRRVVFGCDDVFSVVCGRRDTSQRLSARRRLLSRNRTRSTNYIEESNWSKTSVFVRKLRPSVCST